MNTYNINDENFKNTDIYRSFINDNPVKGYLKMYQKKTLFLNIFLFVIFNSII